MTNPATIPLSQPIQAHGKTTDTITLRPPTGADIRRAGYPMAFGGKGNSTIDADAMSRMIAQLANIPPSSVDQLAMADWNDAMTAVLGFMKAGTPPTSSTVTGNAPESGATQVSSSA